MLHITAVLEVPGIAEYLKTRQLLDQYLEGDVVKVTLIDNHQ